MRFKVSNLCPSSLKLAINFKMTHYHWPWLSIRSRFTLFPRGTLNRVKKKHKLTTFIHSLAQHSLIHWPNDPGSKTRTNWPCELALLALQGKGTDSTQRDQAKSLSYLNKATLGTQRKFTAFNKLKRVQLPPCEDHKGDFWSVSPFTSHRRSTTVSLKT